ncbi:MAG: hypothetical protein AAFQ36_01865 [Pseudomonadota bacterium]
MANVPPKTKPATLASLSKKRSRGLKHSLGICAAVLVFLTASPAIAQVDGIVGGGGRPPVGWSLNTHDLDDNGVIDPNEDLSALQIVEVSSIYDFKTDVITSGLYCGELNKLASSDDFIQESIFSIDVFSSQINTDFSLSFFSKPNTNCFYVFYSSPTAVFLEIADFYDDSTLWVGYDDFHFFVVDLINEFGVENVMRDVVAIFFFGRLERGEASSTLHVFQKGEMIYSAYAIGTQSYRSNRVRYVMSGAD